MSDVNLVKIDMKWASKLIKVISKGVGSLSARFVINQTTKAQVYKINEIAQAIAEANKLPVTASYDDGEVTVKPIDDSLDPVSLPEYRAAEFMIRKETQKLASIEKACIYASEELKNFNDKGGEISNQDVDDNWIANFFDKLGNIKEEKALEYWGKLLAGEIKQPGTFSIRTLNLLSSLSNEDSKLIARALNLAVLQIPPKFSNLSPSDNLGLIYENLKIYKDNKNVLNHYEIQMLSSMGIIFPSESTISIIFENSEKGQLYYGDYAVYFSRDINKNKKAIKSRGVRLLTNIGLELLELNKCNINVKYLLDLSSKISKKPLDYEVVSGLYFENDLIKYKNKIMEFKST